MTSVQQLFLRANKQKALDYYLASNLGQNNTLSKSDNFNEESMHVTQIDRQKYLTNRKTNKESGPYRHSHPTDQIDKSTRAPSLAGPHFLPLLSLLFASLYLYLPKKMARLSFLLHEGVRYKKKSRPSRIVHVKGPYKHY